MALVHAQPNDAVQRIFAGIAEAISGEPGHDAISALATATVRCFVQARQRGGDDPQVRAWMRSVGERFIALSECPIEDSQYDPPSARPVATASENEAIRAPEKQHSPLPWSVDATNLRDVIFRDAKGDELGYLYTNDGADDPTWFPVVGNAKLIIQGVNSHHALVAENATLRADLDAERLGNQTIFDEATRQHDVIVEAIKTHEQYIASHHALLVALRGLKHGDADCWCAFGIGNPMFPNHSAQCVAARAALQLAEDK